MANPNVTTLQPRMMIITGLVRIAWIQSKFSNIFVELLSRRAGEVPRPFRRFRFAPTDPRSALAGLPLELRHTIGRDRDQFLVSRVADDVAIRRDRPRVFVAGARR